MRVRRGAGADTAGATDLRERVCRLGLWGSGLNSSSSSTSCLVMVVLPSSSEDSTRVRLVAARREGREDMLLSGAVSGRGTGVCG